ncbi:hypothetical protein NLU13_8489 [Sarocladium strictum]|uniref:RRM domain-containing protein n=1 Tax=Sarocladium strictum TaxID=5046 RepID=A0AA39GE53_SARSR|nr:hypothetical protein NLU13_8489 [Sarocladium strictum]
MPEPEPELQATANLSPVSPAPVHTAPALAVPALQETVDTINAMVAAALAPNGTATEDEPVVDPELAPTADDDDVVDDDSFNDAYAEEDTAGDAAPTTAQEASPDDADEYAKTFDSPVASEQGDENASRSPSSPAIQKQQNEQLPSKSPHAVSSQASDTTAEPTSPDAGAVSNDPAEAGTAPSDPSSAQDAAQNGAPAAPRPSSEMSPAQAQDDAADIMQLVADLTSQPNETSPSADVKPAQLAVETTAPPATLPSSALPSPASLPPRPPIPHNTPSYPGQHHPGQGPISVANPQMTQPNHPQATYNPPSAPSTAGLVAPSVTHAPPSYQTQAPGYPTEASQEDEYQHKWDQFLADERQYMTEAKWDRFPEGSRIFIGNLSSDKVSKRDVFDMFHRFGRLAQISLKSAYGFVQYHTVEEGKAAVDNLEGVEIKGRRIHLEISRVQDKTKKDRARSPDKGRGRDRDGRRGDRYSHGRDEYRSGREASPRRSDYRGRDDQYRSGRSSFDGGRNRRRSRSPGYERHDQDSYRRRSPSPYGRSHGDSDFDRPKRYGADVPDVQIIMEPDVHRDFATWVETAFKGRGLRTEVMFLHPRMPKDQVIQQQAAEGVHAVVDLDVRAQSLSKVPVQAFDRSAGLNNVRFEQYVDLDPGVAAEVILRAKASGTARYGLQQQQQQPQQQQQQSYGGYNQAYGQPQQLAGPGYGAPAPLGYSQPPPQQPAGNAADIAALMGQVDPATLQKLIATIQAPAHAGVPPAAAAATAAPPGGGLDLQAILSSLGGQQPAAPQGTAPQGHYGAPYGAQQQAPPQQPPPQSGAPATGDAAAQVQNIMAQLARYR